MGLYLHSSPLKVLNAVCQHLSHQTHLHVDGRGCNTCWLFIMPSSGWRCEDDIPPWYYNCTQQCPLVDRYRWDKSDSFLYMDVFPPGATFFTVTGLQPITTYNFSVNAHNAMGESGFADNNAVLTITTKGQLRVTPAWHQKGCAVQPSDHL